MLTLPRKALKVVCVCKSSKMVKGLSSNPVDESDLDQGNGLAGGYCFYLPTWLANVHLVLLSWRSLNWSLYIWALLGSELVNCYVLGVIYFWVLTMITKILLKFWGLNQCIKTFKLTSNNDILLHVLMSSTVVTSVMTSIITTHLNTWSLVLTNWQQ